MHQNFAKIQSALKLAKLLNVAKSTVTNLLKVFGERLSTDRKAGLGEKSKAGGHSDDKKSYPLFRAEPQPLRPRCRKETGSGAFNRA